MTGFEMVVFDTDEGRIERLRSGIRLPFLSFAIGNGPMVAKAERLDAMWLTPMQAERYGASPPFPLHRAQLMPTPMKEIEKGLPPFAVVGVAISPDDPTDPSWQLSLVVKAMALVIRDTQNDETRPISRVGMLPEHLLLNKLRADEASTIIERAYHEVYPRP